MYYRQRQQRRQIGALLAYNADLTRYCHTVAGSGGLDGNNRKPSNLRVMLCSNNVGFDRVYFQ